MITGNERRMELNDITVKILKVNLEDFTRIDHFREDLASFFRKV
jgi:hypothetical protein